MSSSSADIDVYTCQHGGPGELTVEDKKLFVIGYEHNRAAARKAQGLAQYQEVLATELVVFETLMKQNETLRKMVDSELMRLYFGQATVCLLKTQLENARVKARMGVYIAMYLKHGEKFWEMTQLDAPAQQKVLEDMYIALGQIALDTGLPRLLNQQTPCNCLEQALPALKDKK
eukprot:scaffold1450_cov170-Amphora_coffeaeformis.AAC.7